jgi:hypothetical protein
VYPPLPPDAVAVQVVGVPIDPCDGQDNEAVTPPGGGGGGGGGGADPVIVTLVTAGVPIHVFGALVAQTVTLNVPALE